jgi:GNAT superfamily N-acetyltransferase
MSTDPREDGDGVLACALADARFHELAFAPLGVPIRRTAGLWWGVRPAAPFFMTAGTLSPAATSAAVLARIEALPGAQQVRDCWGRLDLTGAGFTVELDDPWMVRPPGPLPGRSVAGLVVRRARTPQDVLLFERTGVLGTGDDPPPGYRDGDLHPASTTPTDGDLHLFTGFLDGEPVATALAAVHPAVVMVGAVRTRPDVRGRGVGTALTAAAIAAAPDRPAALGARPLGVGVYRRMGFTACGHALLWNRTEAGSLRAGRVPGHRGADPVGERDRHQALGDRRA